MRTSHTFGQSFSRISISVSSSCPAGTFHRTCIFENGALSISRALSLSLGPINNFLHLNSIAGYDPYFKLSILLIEDILHKDHHIWSLLVLSQ